MHNYLEIKDKQQLEEWTSLKCSDILFDSNIDHWSVNDTVFDDRIMGKKQLVFLIQDERGEKFGYYLNTQINYEYAIDTMKKTDAKSFEFNLQSNGRLTGPMKFEIKNLKHGYGLKNKSHKILIQIGNIQLLKENEHNLSKCLQKEDIFDYHGIENAVCGRTRYRDENGERQGEYFTLKRILVIQMK